MVIQSRHTESTHDVAALGIGEATTAATSGNATVPDFAMGSGECGDFGNAYSSSGGSSRGGGGQGVGQVCYDAEGYE